jgi:dolichol-phosphate mannosyltransferase
MQEASRSPGDGSVTEKTLSVIFPVYQNEGSLPGLAEELAGFERGLAEAGLHAEVIFVDDGSTDDSLKELLSIKAKRAETKVIRLSRNFGAVAASKTGMRFVTGDCFIIVAADQQDPLDQVLIMARHWLAGHKFVVSARATRQDDFSTQLLARAYYGLIHQLVTPDYPPGGFDLMLMDRVMLPYVLNSAAHININMYALWLGFSPLILSYHRRQRQHGKSQWTFSKKFKFFVDTITGFSVVPIRLISAIGMLMAVVSFTYALWIFINATLGRVPVSGFATIIVLMSFCFGLVLVMLGVIGEYIWRSFEMLSAKPEAIIDETFL